MCIIKYTSVQNFHSYSTHNIYTSQKEVFQILKKQQKIHSLDILDLYIERRIYGRNMRDKTARRGT